MLVSNENGGPVAGSRVVLIPDQKYKRTDLYRETVSDANSKYQFNQIVDGDYMLFAWTNLEGYPYFDPQFVLAFQDSAIPVHIAQDTVVSVAIRAKPAPKRPSDPK